MDYRYHIHGRPVEVQHQPGHEDHFYDYRATFADWRAGTPFYEATAETEFGAYLNLVNAYNGGK